MDLTPNQDVPEVFAFVSIPFMAQSEVHDRKQFQAEGHWVSGLTDDKGFRRPWQGDKVYILTLRRQGEIVARAQGDSAEDVKRRMSQNLEGLFWAMWTAQQLQVGDQGAFQALKDKVDRLATFIQDQYAWEAETGKHGTMEPVDLALHYMGKERGRLSVRLGRLFRRITGR